MVSSRAVSHSREFTGVSDLAAFDNEATYSGNTLPRGPGGLKSPGIPKVLSLFGDALKVFNDGLHRDLRPIGTAGLKFHHTSRNVLL